jgi:hypothetical protein
MQRLENENLAASFLWLALDVVIGALIVTTYVLASGTNDAPSWIRGTVLSLGFVLPSEILRRYVGWNRLASFASRVPVKLLRGQPQLSRSSEPFYAAFSCSYEPDTPSGCVVAVPEGFVTRLQTAAATGMISEDLLAELSQRVYALALGVSLTKTQIEVLRNTARRTGVTFSIARRGTRAFIIADTGCMAETRTEVEGFTRIERARDYRSLDPALA